MHITYTCRNVKTCLQARTYVLYVLQQQHGITHCMVLWWYVMCISSFVPLQTLHSILCNSWTSLNLILARSLWKSLSRALPQARGEGCCCLMLSEVEAYSRGSQKAVPYGALRGISTAAFLFAIEWFFVNRSAICSVSRVWYRKIKTERWR